MSSPERDSDGTLDLERDVPTTVEDIAVLRRLRHDVPSWFALGRAELEALLPSTLIDRRPVTRSDARPFELPAIPDLK